MQGIPSSRPACYSHNVSNVLHAIFESLSALQKPLDQPHAAFIESIGS